MPLDHKEWGKQDRISELERVEQIRLKNRKYYVNNRGKVIKKVQTNYRTKRAQLIMSLGGTCRFCGESSPELLNFHHTIPMMVYENKIYHYHRNIDILCLLCVKCHTTYHAVMDQLRIDDIFKEGGLEW